MQGYSTAGENSPTALTDGSRNVASVRKVNKLLDVSVNEHFRDLVTYVDDAFPASLWDDLGNGRGGVGGGGSGANTQQQPLATPPQLMGASLRNTLEERVMLLHSQFLREFKTVYDAYSEANLCIGELDKISADLDRQMSTQSAEADALMMTVSTLRAEREMILEREREVRKFKEKYQFSRDEQQMLERGTVDVGYLDLLDKARTIHLKCKEMVVKGAAGLLVDDAGTAASPAFQQQQYSAAQVMESSYVTLLKASEKISKYVVDMTASVMSADVPEIPSLYVRCVHALQRDNRAQWQLALREIVRVRKASVDRRYFHLITNGSPLIASGTYFNAGNNMSGGGRAAGQNAGQGMRPLEAEVDDPVYFFSSLFAWLHQSIVEEDDLLSAFFSGTYSNERSEGATPDAHSSSAAGGGDDNAKEPSSLSPSVVKGEMLDELFENLVKRIRGMLDGIMERVRQSTNSKLNAWNAVANGNLATRSIASSGQGDRSGGLLGGRLIGGIGRFFTGQREGGEAGVGSSDGVRPASGGASLLPFPPHIFANYERGGTMSLQVSPALTALSQAMITSFQTEGLFVFYGNTTFTPLLGPKAALTHFVTVTGKLEVLSLLYDLVKQLSMRLLTTTSEVVVSQIPVLELLKNNSPFSPFAHLAHASFVCQLSDEDLADTAAQLQQRGAEPAPEALVGILRGGGSSSPSSLASQFLHMMCAYVLETPPEMHEALRILRVMLTEIEKTAPLQHKAGAIDVQKQTQPPETRAEDLLPFVNTLLSFRQLLQQQQRITTNVDIPSLLVLRMNVYSTISEALRSSVYTFSLSAAVQADIERESSLFEAITSSILCWYHGFLSVTQVSTQLLPPLSEAVKSQLPARTGAESGAKEANVFVSVVEQHLLGMDEAAPSDAAKTRQSLWTRADGNGSDVDGGIRVLQNFYASVGATGMLTVPLLAAVESARLREKVRCDVSRNLCWVYELIFNEMSEALSSQATASSPAHAEALDQLEPHKLRVLLDIHKV